MFVFKHSLVFYDVSLSNNHLKLIKSDIKKLVKCYVYKFLGHPGLHHTWLSSQFNVRSDFLPDSRQCMWLPTNAVALASMSSLLLLSRGGRSIAAWAWKHVFKSLLRWGAHWEKEDDRDCHCDVKGGATDSCNIGGLAQRVVCPDHVTDWAMML
jgi:hypothetical protein